MVNEVDLFISKLIDKILKYHQIPTHREVYKFGLIVLDKIVLNPLLNDNHTIRYRYYEYYE